MKMKAAVYHGPKDLRVEEIEVRVESLAIIDHFEDGKVVFR